MRDRLPAPLRRLAATFGSFTPGQKVVTVLGVIVLVAGGFLFTRWASAPSYAPLFSNLSGADASAIVDELNSAGTPYELADGGQTVMVPADQVYDLRLQMSGKGLPAEADTGYSLLDKQGVTTSDFMQHVGYQRALEGELSKTIKSIDGVKAATVHLVIPKKDVFSEDSSKPTASVLVATSPGQALDSGQVQSIIHLVASSVEGLDPKHVAVASSDGTVLSPGDGRSAGGGDERGQRTAQFEQRMNGALQQMLDSVVGAGHAVVKTSADLDFDETERKTQTYTADPSTPPLSQSSNRESYTGNANNGGVLGPDNIQVPNTAASAGSYESSSETRTNAVGMVTETRRSAPGNVRRLSVSVLLDSKVAPNIDTAQVEQMISNAAGVTTARGDTVAVTLLPFDETAATEAEKTLAEAQQAQQREQWVAWAKNGAMVLAVLVLVFLAWRASRRSRRSRLTDEELAQLAEMQTAMEATRTPAMVGAGGGGETPALEAGDHDGDNGRAVRQHEIAQMVEQQPDEVAALLRSWLADRRA